MGPGLFFGSHRPGFDRRLPRAAGIRGKGRRKERPCRGILWGALRFPDAPSSGDTPCRFPGPCPHVWPAGTFSPPGTAVSPVRRALPARREDTPPAFGERGTWPATSRRTRPASLVTLRDCPASAIAQAGSFFAPADSKPQANAARGLLSTG